MTLQLSKATRRQMNKYNQLFKDMKNIAFRLTAIMALMMITMAAQANRWSSENRAMLASALSSRDLIRQNVKLIKNNNETRDY